MGTSLGPEDKVEDGPVPCLLALSGDYDLRFTPRRSCRSSTKDRTFRKEVNVEGEWVSKGTSPLGTPT